MKFSVLFFICFILCAVFAENVQPTPVAQAAVPVAQPVQPAAKIEDSAAFKQLQASVTKKNEEFASSLSTVLSQINSLKSTIEALQKENAQLKETIVTLTTKKEDKKDNTANKAIAELRGQIEALKLEIAESSALFIANKYFQTAQTVGTKYYNIVMKNAAPALSKLQTQTASLLKVAQPHLTKVSAVAQTAFDKSISVINKNLPIVREALNKQAVALNIPSEHVSFVVVSVLTVAILLASTIFVAIINAFLSLFCCCKRSAVAKK